MATLGEVVREGLFCTECPYNKDCKKECDKIEVK